MVLPVAQWQLDVIVASMYCSGPGQPAALLHLWWMLREVSSSLKIACLFDPPKPWFILCSFSGSLSGYTQVIGYVRQGVYFEAKALSIEFSLEYFPVKGVLPKASEYLSGLQLLQSWPSFSLASRSDLVHHLRPHLLVIGPS